jgi:hypothetical protein
MRATIARKTRWRASRATSRDDAPRRRVPASGGVEWAGPSRRARVIAVLLSIAFAAITLAVVSRVWRQAAPPPPPRPTSVEVRLVPLSPPPVPATPPTPTR